MPQDWTPRHALALALVVATGLASAGASSAAEAWAPSRTVRIVVPIVGSTNDTVARLVAAELAPVLGQAVIVENKPGAGGNIGADLVAKAPPDGHTLLIGYNGPIAINPTLFAQMPYDPVKDLAPITLAVQSPQFLVLHPGVPAKTVAELVAVAKAQPGKLSYGSVAVGSASHLTMEMLKTAAGIDLTHVPYKGAAPAVTDLLAGEVKAAFLVPGNILQHMYAGTARAIAASGRARFAAAPDVPTLIELGYADFVAVSWIGFLAPGATPKPIIERYHDEITRILRSSEVRAKLEDIQFEIVAGTPAQFADWIRAEIPRWAAVIQATGARVE